VDRDPAEIERSTEIGRRTEAEANSFADLGVSLFTVGLSGPEYDIAKVRTWVAWRDARNAG
jgi:hypothetical protein